MSDVQILGICMMLLPFVIAFAITCHCLGPWRALAELCAAAIVAAAIIGGLSLVLYEDFRLWTSPLKEILRL